MKLAFYHARKGGWADRLIAAYTRGPFSHVEVVFEDCFRSILPQRYVYLHDPGGALCYSSSEMLPRCGCGFESITLEDGKWKVYEVPVGKAAEMEAIKQAVKDSK